MERASNLPNKEGGMCVVRTKEGEEGEREEERGRGGTNPLVSKEREGTGEGEEEREREALSKRVGVERGEEGGVREGEGARELFEVEYFMEEGEGEGEGKGGGPDRER